ncbi:MAG: hypothetical protein ABEJ65_09485, partial [bacterium]
MNNPELKQYLEQLKIKIHPGDAVRLGDLTSPPNWSSLAWKVGWVVEEGYTGLHFVVCEEGEWEQLTGEFGSSREQKTDSFGRGFAAFMSEWASRLGQPLKAKNVKYRQIDFTAFEGRERIQKETWWLINFSDRMTGTWYYVFPQRLYQLFEEDEESTPPIPQPPWNFTELWKKVSSAEHQELMQKLGPRRELLNHVTALVAAGELSSEQILDNLPVNPRDDFKQLLSRRREMLQDQPSTERRQILARWKGDAHSALVDEIGEWLMEDELNAPGWSSLTQEWEDYRTEL